MLQIQGFGRLAPNRRAVKVAAAEHSAIVLTEAGEVGPLAAFRGRMLQHRSSAAPRYALGCSGLRQPAAAAPVKPQQAPGSQPGFAACMCRRVLHGVVLRAWPCVDWTCTHAQERSLMAVNPPQVWGWGNTGMEQQGESDLPVLIKGLPPHLAAVAASGGHQHFLTVLSEVSHALLDSCWEALKHDARAPCQDSRGAALGRQQEMPALGVKGAQHLLHHAYVRSAVVAPAWSCVCCWQTCS